MTKTLIITISKEISFLYKNKILLQYLIFNIILKSKIKYKNIKSNKININKMLAK